MNTRNRIGFKTSTILEEEIEQENEIATMQNISNSDEIQKGEFLSPAHLEIKGKLLFLQDLITSADFSSLDEQERKEYLDEFKFFSALDAQLYFSY